jgi:endonuclease/exonuclease/phosphatase family metal-dependent hydrolase
MRFFAILIFICLFSQKAMSLEHGSTVNYPVGELGEKWQFPSDHLPVAATIGNVNIALWNTLNTRYIYHIHANHQGLKGSLITTANVQKDPSSRLTCREEMIVDMVLEMADHPETPRGLIALQEIGEEIFKELQRRLPTKMVCVTTFPNDLANGDIFLYDRNQFDYVSLCSDCYQVRPQNTYMTLTLQEKETGSLFRFIQSHVPGGPAASAPARKEWAEDILLNFDPDSVTIVMGDMNRSPDYFQKDLQTVAEEFGLERHPFKNLWIPYPTHIDTYQRASWIDNFFIYLPDESLKVEAERIPARIAHPLLDTAFLLEELRPQPLDVSFELWAQLSGHRFALLHRSSGNGALEQLQLALKSSRYALFNVRQLFLDACAIEPGLPPDARAKREREWIKAHKLELIALGDDAEVVVIDQFDEREFIEGLTGDKLECVLEVVDIAKNLFQKNKSVVLMASRTGEYPQKVWHHLSEKFSYCRANLIQPGFINRKEEERLLSHTVLTEEEKARFMAQSAGVPSAYLAIMDDLSGKNPAVDLDYENLCAQTLAHLEGQWEELLSREPPCVREMLQELACGLLSLEDCISSPGFARAVVAGFVGRRKDLWVVPEIVKEFILTHTSP